MARSRVVWDQSQFDKQLGELRNSLGPTMRAAALGSAIRTAKHAHDTKFIEANPPFLNRRTGRAARSIAASPRARLTRDAAVAEWGSNVDYVLKHERGGTHREFVKAHRVRAHQRRIAAFEITRITQRKAVNVRSYFVRGHFVFRRYRRREMIATAAREMVDYPAKAARAAVELLIRNRKVPTANQVVQAVRA